MPVTMATRKWYSPLDMTEDQAAMLCTKSRSGMVSKGLRELADTDFLTALCKKKGFPVINLS